jgi:quercetin dioxygenase-like cupin family protein
MSLYASDESVPEDIVDMGNTRFSTKVIFGNNASFMMATRPAGYHSRPHTHDAEQLNLLQSGELWIFIEDEAVRLRAGDYLRIPPNAIHWSWNRSDQSCVLLEVHSPGLQDDPIVSSFAVGLFGPDEERDYLGSPANTFLPGDSPFDPLVAEAKAEEPFS